MTDNGVGQADDLDPRPRVLHVITSFGRGGAETMLLRLLLASRDGPFHHGLITLRDQATLLPTLKDAKIPAWSLEMPGLRVPGPALLRRFAHLVRDFRADLIQGWLYHGNLAALGAARLSGQRPPVLFNLRNTLYHLRQEPPLTRLAIRLGGRLSRRAVAVVHNAQLSVQHHARVGYAPARAVVIPNGVDCREFAPDPAARHAVRAELGLDPATPLIGRICRFHPMKDHAGFLAAASRLLAAGHEAHFLLAGRGVGADNPHLQGWLRDCPAPERFHLLGERTDIARLNAALDIAVSSSAWGEGFPNALAEAAACGVPCIATDVGESARIVGPAGRVVAPGDVPALVAAMAELLGSAALRRELGRLGRERIVTGFSLPMAVASYQELYRRVLAGETLEGPAGDVLADRQPHC